MQIIKQNHIDSSDTTENRKCEVKKKKLLSRLYRKWYEILLDVEEMHSDSIVVEIGTGAGFMKELFPHIICTDVLPISGIDLVMDAMLLSIKNTKVYKFIMIDAFHHVKNSGKFLEEMQRCLVPGAKIVMIEPSNTVWGRFIWKYFHHEDFLPDVKEWKIEGNGPLSSANSAMPWIVFCRDRKKFEQRFPQLMIEKISTHTSISYLLSGGFSYPQFVLNIFVKPVLFFDEVICKCFPFLGMFVTIKLKKKV